jgi:hypothetical protein
MSPSQENLNCAEFQARLAEMIGAGENVSAHPHMQDCELCRAFLGELEAIAQAARDLFPAVEPPDDLWNNIESAINSGK